MNRGRSAVAALALVAGGAAAQHAQGSPSATAGARVTAGTGLKVVPGDFSSRVTNPWYPLRAGTTFRYKGNEDGEASVDVYEVTHRVKRIMGVPCIVVRDRNYVAGRLEESTLDYYTQHRDGTVWYFGEATQTYDRNGHPKSTEGSWQAGVNGAKPGIFMRLHPRVGQSFRQEYYKGHAEDHFRVLSLHASVTVPYGTYRKRALLTEEWSPLDKAGTPRERKYYAYGVGKLREGDGKLVSVTHR